MTDAHIHAYTTYIYKYTVGGKYVKTLLCYHQGRPSSPLNRRVNYSANHQVHITLHHQWRFVTWMRVILAQIIISFYCCLVKTLSNGLVWVVSGTCALSYSSCSCCCSVTWSHTNVIACRWLSETMRVCIHLSSWLNHQLLVDCAILYTTYAISLKILTIHGWCNQSFRSCKTIEMIQAAIYVNILLLRKMKWETKTRDETNTKWTT